MSRNSTIKKKPSSIGLVKSSRNKEIHGLTKWTHETILMEAAKYQTRGDFKIYSFGAYNKARKLGILDEVCDHMEERSWTVERVKEVARKYSDKNEFRKKDKKAYEAARRLDCMEEVTSWMIDSFKPGVPKKWNREKILKILPEYKSVTEFCRKKGRAYLTALELGMSEELKEYYKSK